MPEQKLNLARIKKFGHNFEISVEPDSAIKYKKGELTDLREVLLAENIFTDAKKGLIAPQDLLIEAFKTTQMEKIADLILKEGEIQATSEHRSQEREQLLKKLIHLINRNTVNPTTGLPHPPTRIEAALEQGKIHPDYNKTVEEQFEDIVDKLRPIIPLKVEQKEIVVIVPSQHSGRLYQFVKDNSKMLKEEWLNNGDWKVKVEVPAGFQQEFIDKLNSLSHGEMIVEI